MGQITFSIDPKLEEDFRKQAHFTEQDEIQSELR